MRKSEYIPSLLIFAFGILLYTNTINHDYALDDKIVITENQFVKKGFEGISDIFTTDSFQGFYGEKTGYVAGGRYRPLSLFTFAVEYGLFGKNPAISHFINALLYAFTGLLLFVILKRLIPIYEKEKWFLTLPFVSVMLFVAHPLHTEAIANIKGRDEILCFLFSFGALHYFISYLDYQRIGKLIFAVGSLFLAMLSKETGITFLLIIPLTVYFFTEYSLKKTLMVVVPLIVGVGVYLIIRFNILGQPSAGAVNELMNNPFAQSSVSDKFATIFYTFGLYLKLLFYPHPLTHDYYPKQIPIISWQDLRAIIPLFIYSFLTIYALFQVKKKKIVAYGILFYLITFSIVSNIVFPIGTFMNERFLYFPSFGFCLIAAHLILNYIKKLNKNRHNLTIVVSIFIIILVSFSAKTISRNGSWKDDYTLSTTDVITSSGSAKANMAAGSSYIERAREVSDPNQKKLIIEKAIHYLTKSISIYPTYHHSWVLLGNAYYEIEDYGSAMDQYEQCIAVAPGFKDVINNIQHVSELTTQKEQFNIAVRGYKTLIKYYPKNTLYYKKLGELYGKNLNDQENALKYLLKARTLDPKDTDILQKIGVVYAMQNEHQKALELFLTANDLDPGNAYILMNIGIVYSTIGDLEKSNKYLNKAFEINPSLKR